MIRSSAPRHNGWLVFPTNVGRFGRDYLLRAVVADVLDILRGAGDPQSVGARWAETCTGSGRCLRACDDGVNPRFMLAMTRVALNQRKAEADRRSAGQTGFNTMSRGVKVLSRLQLPADFVARVTRSAHASDGPVPEVVLYLGCNVMKTPHIALLCMDVLDRIGGILTKLCQHVRVGVHGHADLRVRLPQRHLVVDDEL